MSENYERPREAFDGPVPDEAVVVEDSVVEVDGEIVAGEVVTAEDAAGDIVVGSVVETAADEPIFDLADNPVAVEETPTTLLVEEVVADSGVVPGWYTNPTSPAEERYWDGSGWTEDVRPLTLTASPLAGAMTDSAGRLLMDASGNAVSPKSRLVAALLAFFLGGLGIHRFYVGKIGTGILMIVTFGGFGVWVLIDFIMILVGSFRDIERRLLLNWN